MVEDVDGRGALVAAGRRRIGLARNPVAWVAGLMATTAAIALAAVLVVVFAATLALVLVLTAAVLASVAAAWRLGQRGVTRERLEDGAGGALASTLAPRVGGGRVGHSWVAYGWDRQA